MVSESNPSRSPLALAALATVAVPGLDVVATRPPRHPGADFDVTGLMDAGGRRWMVRAPKNAAAGAAMEGEVALLTALAQAADAGEITFDVPRPVGFAPLPEGGHAMVYRELLGRPLPLQSLSGGPGLAAQVGRAIASLHELPDSLVSDAGLPHYDSETYRLRRLAEVDEAARTGHVPVGLLRRWEHALEDVRLWRFRATPVHGDLAAEHVLVADGEVVAIIDWSDARVADPADDLAWLLSSAPENSLDAILEAYALARTERSDAHLAARALLASELAVARWLLHGVRHRDGDIIDDAVQMLHDLDEAVAEEPPIGYTEPVVVPDALVVEESEDASGWVDADQDTGWVDADVDLGAGARERRVLRSDGADEPVEDRDVESPAVEDHPFTARAVEEHTVPEPRLHESEVFKELAERDFAEPPSFDEIMRADDDAAEHPVQYPDRAATHARSATDTRDTGLHPRAGARRSDEPDEGEEPAPDVPPDDSSDPGRQEPEHGRAQPRRGVDDTPTMEIPPTRD